MKKIMSCFCVLLALAGLLAFAACGTNETEIAVTSVTLDKTETTLKIGETVKLTATVAPANATDKTVAWKSSADAVATVNNGTVTAVATGTATVTATAGNKSATCTVTVLHASDKVTVGGQEYASLSAAVEAADDGAVIEISNGTYTLDEPLTLSKSVTLRGEAGYTQIDTAEKGDVITVSAENVTVEGITFNKTDKAVETSFSFIHAERNNLTVKNCTFTGKYEDGDSEVARALVFNAGVSGYTIEGNTFKNLRQPAYLEGEGTVKNNAVEGTRGFVVCCNYKVVFEGNTFQNNVADIAIIPNASAQNVYTEEDAVKISKDNNGAYVDHQPLNVKIKNGAKVTE